MDFEFSAEQEAMLRTTRKFLQEQAPIRPYVRDQLKTESGTSQAVWRGLADLGATGLLVPEAHGGSGLTMVDMGVVLEEMGRCVHPGPFLSSAVGAVSAVLAAGSEEDRKDLLPNLASGEANGALALSEPDDRSARPGWRGEHRPATLATPRGEGHALTGGTGRAHPAARPGASPRPR